MTGRPSSYTVEVGERICQRIANGEALSHICRDDDMPGRQTVLDWMNAVGVEFDAFRANHARAREAQADVMDELIMEVADACTSETAAADRVKIGAYQWRAARLNSKRYGDKLGLGHADGLEPVKLGVSVEFVKPS